MESKGTSLMVLNKNFLKLVVLFLPQLVFSFGLAIANEKDPSVDRYMDWLGKTTRGAQGESAASYGSMGFSLSTSTAYHPIPIEEIEIASQQLFEDKQADGLTLFSLGVAKGFSWPINLGAQFARNADNTLSQASGFVQWTLFESFALPAIALRTGYSRLFGMRSSESSSISGDGVMSWGFRNFSVFATMGLAVNSQSMRLVQEDMDRFGLRSQDSEWFQLRKSQTNHHSLGVQLRIIPTLLTVALEWSRGSQDYESFLAKLSMQI
jgi:hypothetical protein